MSSGPLLFLYAGADSRCRRALRIGGDRITTCRKCGEALPAARARCTVCGPVGRPP